MLNMHGHNLERLHRIIRSNLDKWKAGKLAHSIAIGTSAKRAISRLTLPIVDSIYTASGNINWSLSSVNKRDNGLLLFRNAVRAYKL